MTTRERNCKSVRLKSIGVAAQMTLMVLGAFPLSLSAQQSGSPNVKVASRRMGDGKVWTTENLNVETASSYCYGGLDGNCRKYGRLYSWSAARQVCEALGEGWRLPTNEEWRALASQYGGLREESGDLGNAAYKALMIEGGAGFNAVLGGGRSPSGEYSRIEAHGFYWTASETDSERAWLYNFGKGAQSLNRHNDGEKQRAFAVRCVKD